MDKKNLVSALAICAASATGANACPLAEQANPLSLQDMAAPATSLASTPSESTATQDTAPTFTGGEMFLKAYIKKKVAASGISDKGSVEVSFVVDAKGCIQSAKVTKSAGEAMDKAALAIVSGMPRWKPGTTNGAAVDKPSKVTVVFGE